MGYEYPAIYNFPPFFTKQPNRNTYESQLEQWKEVILGYCKYNRVWALSNSGMKVGSEIEADFEDDIENDDDTEAEAEAGADVKGATVSGDDNIFRNDGIKRHANSEFIRDIYTFLVSEHCAEWVGDDKDKNHNHGIYVLWHSIEEWAQMIYEWVDNTGQTGSIMTLYELRRGELAAREEFYGMHYNILVKVLNTLVKQGKAALMKDEDGKIGGVKFGS
jgi:ESCRT-II complex subunit VPS25